MLRATPQERLALGVTALLLAAGAGVRLVRAGPEPVAWKIGSAASDTNRSEEVGSVRAETEGEVEKNLIRGTPLAPGEKIDPNRASAEELERLPRVGPALARRLVEWRTARGPFRTLADLDSVPGVGPSLLSALTPHLALAAAPARAPAARAEPAGTLDLNRATAAELDALPGVGPVLARRIVHWREQHGPFGSLEELEQVPGIGASLRARLGPGLRVGSR